MKFGKNLLDVVELSDPEWGPFWINYKYLKKKINDIVDNQGTGENRPQKCHPSIVLSNSMSEVEFFKALRSELEKCNKFFVETEQAYKVRHSRILFGYQILQKDGNRFDKNAWSRLLRSCVKFYKDVLMLENFAVMNFCGFSKILKKHDKGTGFSTREAFMRNVVSKRDITDHPSVVQLLKQSEQLFREITSMESLMPLCEEERLFIEAIRDLNHQANRLQRAESDNNLENLAANRVSLDSERATPLLPAPHQSANASGEARAGGAEQPANMEVSRADMTNSNTLDWKSLESGPRGASSIPETLAIAKTVGRTNSLEGALAWIQRINEHKKNLDSSNIAASTTFTATITTTTTTTTTTISADINAEMGVYLSDSDSDRQVEDAVESKASKLFSVALGCGGGRSGGDGAEKKRKLVE